MNENKIRQILEQPFDPSLIKTRPGSFGQDLSYVEGHEYIKRLNEAYDGQWSFDVVSHEVDDKEAIVVGKLTAGGIVKSAFGGSDIKRAKESGEIISLADDLKAAATDSLKKCASLFGVGLHLYGDSPSEKSAPKNSGNGNGAAKTNGNAPSNGGNNGNNGEEKNRLSSRQLGMILGLARERQINRDKLNGMTDERFNRPLEFITKSEASWLIQELQAA